MILIIDYLNCLGINNYFGQYYKKISNFYNDTSDIINRKNMVKISENIKFDNPNYLELPLIRNNGSKTIKQPQHIAKTWLVNRFTAPSKSKELFKR